MTAKTYEKVEHSSEWYADMIPGSSFFELRLNAGDLEELDTLIRSHQAKPSLLQEKENVTSMMPRLSKLMMNVKEQLVQGRGLIILKGLGARKYDQVAMETALIGLGKELGDPVSQSVMGDKLGYERIDIVKSFQCIPICQISSQ